MKDLLGLFREGPGPGCACSSELRPLLRWLQLPQRSPKNGLSLPTAAGGGCCRPRGEDWLLAGPLRTMLVRGLPVTEHDPEVVSEEEASAVWGDRYMLPPSCHCWVKRWLPANAGA